MKKIPYDSGSYYVFNRGYNAFKELYRIHKHESFFVVWSKKNLQYNYIKWRRRMTRNVLTDSEIMLTEYITSKKYSEKLRLVKFYDDEERHKSSFLTNAFHLLRLIYKNRWQIELHII